VPNLNRLPTAPETSTAGLLLSLASALPSASSPLARRARAIAHRLSDGASERALQRRAADLLAQLLTATDCEELAGYADPDCLDSEFDA
jgi:hypothetical protein